MAGDDRSSVTSGIQFISFKMDRIDFSVTQELGVLAQRDHSNCEPVFEFAFRDALKFHGNDTDSYVTGLQVKLTIKNKSDGILRKISIICLTVWHSSCNIVVAVRHSRHS